MADPPRPTRPAVVINPAKVTDEDALRAQISKLCRERQLPDPLWFQTSTQDPGYGQTQQALEQGADLLIACGGDGTVAACGSALVGTDVAMALVPAGTGNLLARNLHIPTDLGGALDVAFGTDRRRIDVGREIEDGRRIQDGRSDAGRHFLVMAGLGFDAAMIEQTNERTKARLGWAAYIGGIARALKGSPSAQLQICIDGAAAVHYRAVGVLVGNVGRLQVGLSVLPQASPTDGVLDLAVFAPNSWRDWALILTRLITGRMADGGRSDVLRGTHIEITCDRVLPLEFDGDVATSVRSLTVDVLPGALSICVPA